ncbi:MAG TPA: cell division protein ZapA [Bacillota bacterium]|jgi:cell division protein ZapA
MSREPIDDRTRVVVNIFGEEYPIKGAGRPEYLQELAASVDRKMRQVSETHPRLSVSRVAVMAALLMADELQKLKEQHDRLTEMYEQEWERRKDRRANE